MQKNSGLTLIEVILVITIIGVIGVTAVTNWETDYISLATEAEILASNIRYSQSLAMSKGDVFKLKKLSGSTYSLTNSQGKALVFSNGKKKYKFSNNIKFTKWQNLNRNLIAFNARGTPFYNSNSPLKELSSDKQYSIGISDGSNVKTIFITPVTGKVEIK